ncbi:hypothetical protein LNP25_22385 [Klebsiella variicola subsp. variicola]|nr:hypothetical protein [Klebsiella variicola subsp. variicola]
MEHLVNDLPHCRLQEWSFRRASRPAGWARDPAVAADGAVAPGDDPFRGRAWQMRPRRRSCCCS